MIVPLDSADAPTRKRYREYQTSRHERPLTVHGEHRIRFAPDLVGPSAEIAERLHADVAVAEVSELRLELPYEFNEHDYRQILHDTRTLIPPWAGTPQPPQPQAA
ncbi:hypothetical protein GCM10022254_42620 [Actinomadura meridiana]|uniref:Uncharacterized protein n=1 Tax=Actinomadura meridiana TaxID=559626 RepID=A0ABP8C858_9ACTN